MRGTLIAVGSGLAVAACCVGTLWAGGPEVPWKAEVEVASRTVVLGEPVYAKIDITNTSDVPVVMPYPLGWGGPFCGIEIEPLDASYSDQFREDLGRVSSDALGVVASKRSYAAGETVLLGWSRAFRALRIGTYRMQYRCDIPPDAIGPEVNPKIKQLESNDEVWRGAFASNEVKVQVVEPQGVDAEAYKALDHAPMSSDRYGELPRRFPNSTYAAYVVWAQNIAGTARRETGGIIEAETRPIATEWNSVPCDLPSRCRGNGWMSLSGKGYVEWRVRWARTVLKAHPDIWFADEVRLKLALDEYLLGDTDSCKATLADLAERGGPDVAAKAADLLAAMRAKGMLEAPATAPAAAPVPAPDPAPGPGSGRRQVQRQRQRSAAASTVSDSASDQRPADPAPVPVPDAGGVLLHPSP